jgi:hypothetical protein
MNGGRIDFKASVPQNKAYLVNIGLRLAPGHIGGADLRRVHSGRGFQSYCIAIGCHGEGLSLSQASILVRLTSHKEFFWVATLLPKIRDPYGPLFRLTSTIGGLFCASLCPLSITHCGNCTGCNGIPTPTGVSLITWEF